MRRPVKKNSQVCTGLCTEYVALCRICNKAGPVHVYRLRIAIGLADARQVIRGIGTNGYKMVTNTIKDNNR
jgi:hypothetical protein